LPSAMRYWPAAMRQPGVAVKPGQQAGIGCHDRTLRFTEHQP
jgi:hypothetical protein